MPAPFSLLLAAADALSLAGPRVVSVRLTREDEAGAVVPWADASVFGGVYGRWDASPPAAARLAAVAGQAGTYARTAGRAELAAAAVAALWDARGILAPPPPAPYEADTLAATDGATVWEVVEVRASDAPGAAVLARYVTRLVATFAAGTV